MSTIILSDPKLVAEFAAATGIIDLRDANGNTIGQFIHRTPGALPPGVKSPITDEELNRRRQDLTGKPLAEILKRLEESNR